MEDEFKVCFTAQKSQLLSIVRSHWDYNPRGWREWYGEEECYEVPDYSDLVSEYS